MEPLLPAMDYSNLTCDRFYSNVANKTTVIAIVGMSYEGIPQNLLINIVVWLVLLILFSVLRKRAWDYGRIALVSRNEARPISIREDSRYNIWTSLFYGEKDKAASEMTGSVESLDKHIDKHDQGFCSWLPAFFRIKDEHILHKSGRDAIQYLTFQRYLIVYLAVVCVCSIAIILPVNFQGDQEGNRQAFGHTTISNIRPNSKLLWVHSVMSLGFLALALYCMRHFAASIRYEEDEQISKAILITRIPPERCFRNTLQQHFQEAYPEVIVTDVQFAYNITKLVSLDRARKHATAGRLQSAALYQDSGQLPTMVPYRCGWLCCCCQRCGCQEVDAITYYSQEEADLKRKCEAEKATAFQDCLGMAFVTFADPAMTERVCSDFSSGCLRSAHPSNSSVSIILETELWDVSYAPSPEDVNWENLSLEPLWWWLRAMVINGILLVILFFLTTPSIVMNTLDSFDYKKALRNSHSAVISQFLPTIILWSFSALLPWVVYYSDQFVGHWTKTAEHHTVMRKTFGFLLIMVVVLPSLGLTSAKAFLEYTLSHESESKKYRWECIFLPDNGAFFVNYVITSAFIGGALELIRFPELFLFIIRMVMARSAAEKNAVRKSVLWEFQFGQNYAWMLCVFSVTMVYSILSPLIVPFGLIYLVIKHSIDRYNLYFAYAPSKINKNIHRSAISFVVVALILLQCNIFFFTMIRSSTRDGLSIFTGIALALTLLLYLGQIFFHWFKNCSPVRYKQFDNEGEDDEEQLKPKPEVKDEGPFIPSILLEEQQQNGTLAVKLRQAYGATEDEPVKVKGEGQVQGEDTSYRSGRESQLADDNVQ